MDCPVKPGVKAGNDAAGADEGASYRGVGSIGAAVEARAAGASSTQAAAAKISAKPMQSASVGRSPSIRTEATMPTTGTLSTPSEAVIAGKRRTISNQRRYATPDPTTPEKIHAASANASTGHRCGRPSTSQRPAPVTAVATMSCQAVTAIGSALIRAHFR